MLTASVALTVLGVWPGFAQRKATIQNVPEIPFSSVPNFLKLPPGEHLGEAVAVATNSKGHVFVFHRSNNNRLFEFDQTGKFVKEIGSGFLGFEFAHSVRVDKDDNIWTVDEGSNMVTKFSPEGRVLMVLGRRPLAVMGMLPAPPPGPSRPAQKYEFCRPTDVGWDPQGNIFVSDGYCNNRVVKYDKDGRFLAQAGSEKPGSALGEFNLPHGLQVDLQGNVWVADTTSNMGGRGGAPAAPRGRGTGYPGGHHDRQRPGVRGGRARCLGGRRHPGVRTPHRRARRRAAAAPLRRAAARRRL